MTARWETMHVARFSFGWEPLQFHNYRIKKAVGLFFKGTTLFMVLYPVLQRRCTLYNFSVS